MVLAEEWKRKEVVGSWDARVRFEMEVRWRDLMKEDMAA
jgi:hypothetical protein